MGASKSLLGADPGPGDCGWLHDVAGGGKERVGVPIPALQHFMLCDFEVTQLSSDATALSLGL
jgi:hypothetical protein